MPKEKHYDFRKRLAVVYPPRLMPDAEPVRCGEVLVSDAWTIVPESDDAVLMHAVCDLQDYFEKSMKVRLELMVPQAGSKVAPAFTGGVIRVGIASEKDVRTSRIAVTAGEIRITGATAREAAQGCYRLEDAMNLRGMPAVSVGQKTFTRMFSPRMTHSGWELEKFPDEYLAHVAHAGMDAIVIFIQESPNITRNGPIDLDAVVKHAAEFGIDVYVYPHAYQKAAECHPSAPNAAEFYDSLYGSIVKHAPGIKGLVFVGESCAFPSRDPNSKGYWWNPQPGGKYLNGFWPVYDWPEWLSRIRDTTRRYNPGLEILFWSYNWNWAPEKDRINLLENIPTDVTLHVTYEMGNTLVETCGVPMRLDDYSITRQGPSDTFVSEAQVAARRGIKLTSMTNTAGMTWDYGVIPYMPVPYRWRDRYRTLRDSRTKFGLGGLMESHHYGFTPSFISELAKVCFTAETSADVDFDAAITAIAARDFGRENVTDALAVWKDWSESFLWHSTRSFDQYGALRVGPAYPLALPGDKLPDPAFKTDDSSVYVKGWRYVHPSFQMPHEHIAGHLEMAERELALLASGNARLEKLLARVAPERYDHARRMLGIGEFMHHTVRTMRNVKMFYRDGLVYRRETSTPEEKESARRSLLAIIADEEQNVRDTIPWVEYDSRLGWEPSMLYTTDRAGLEWKLDTLRSLAARLMQTGPRMSD